MRPDRTLDVSGRIIAPWETDENAWAFTLSLAPVAKARPRFKHGGVAFHSTRYRVLLATAKAELAAAWRSREPLTCALAITITMAGPSRPRPDLDNGAGFLLDCMQGIVIADDKQVVALHVTIAAAKTWTQTLELARANPPNYAAAKRR